MRETETGTESRSSVNAECYDDTILMERPENANFQSGLVLETVLSTLCAYF